MSLDPADVKSTLVQIMAWCHQAASYYLSQCWSWFMSLHDVTRPQPVYDCTFKLNISTKIRRKERQNIWKFRHFSGMVFTNLIHSTAHEWHLPFNTTWWPLLGQCKQMLVPSHPCQITASHLKIWYPTTHRFQLYVPDLGFKWVVTTWFERQETRIQLVLPIYHGRVYRGIGYIAVACWTPFFWCPRTQYFSWNRSNSLDPIHGRQFFAKCAHHDRLCSQFAGDNFSQNKL